jgi:hypothetical protein
LRGIRPILEGLIEAFEHLARVGPDRLRRNRHAVLAKGNCRSNLLTCDLSIKPAPFRPEATLYIGGTVLPERNYLISPGLPPCCRNCWPPHCVRGGCCTFRAASAMASAEPCGKWPTTALTYGLK